MIVIGVLVTGCKITTYERLATDGSSVRLKDSRFFMNTDAEITFEAQSNEVRRVTVQGRSEPSSKALQSAMEGLGTGITKGLVPK